VVLGAVVTCTKHKILDSKSKCKLTKARDEYETGLASKAFKQFCNVHSHTLRIT
jgi:hypothetical protein